MYVKGISSIKIKGVLFNERISAAKEAILSSNLPDQAKKMAADLWDEISELAKVRNRVAHNPIVMGFSPSQNEHVFSIIDLKKTVPVGIHELEQLDRTEIEKTALRMGDINKILLSIIESVP